MKKKKYEELEEEIKELKMDYREARKEICELNSYSEILLEARNYWRTEARKGEDLK